MPSTQCPSVEQLRRAVEIAQQIETLHGELKGLLGGNGTAAPITAAVSTAAEGPQKAGAPTKKALRGKRRKMSAEARERIAAAQRARWAAQRAGKQ